MAAGAEYPILHFEDATAWEAWLAEHHATQPGVWLRYARAASSQTSVAHTGALDVALCYGWIDGQARGLDAETWLQKFTPRGKRSLWSKRNRERVERLSESGAMRPSGLAAVEAAKADGRWDRAYDSPATATVPDDLQAALDGNPRAAEQFASLRRSARFALLYRIQTAARPETRAGRIETFVGKLERGDDC